ncbi:MAG TPA: BlaI/MecI/CopY family transcriptional regulator [Candidatus Blautia intestinigallinarum]|nr:BlaI/MecI/CopY family transcriptional regulator [Candidatus Blautia intestinigallinarum]
MQDKMNKYFYLSPREEAAMKVLWNTEEELSASEIANRIPDRSWPVSSIQNTLKTLEKKGAIQVSSITKLGKSYGRLFRPTLSSNEYAAMQFTRYYQHESHDSLSMLTSLLGNANADKQEIIDTLHSLLRQYEED